MRQDRGSKELSNSKTVFHAIDRQAGRQAGTPMKNEAEKRLHDLLHQLKQERDQLRVRTHLLKADLKQEWEEVELKWQNVEIKLQHLRTSVQDSSEGVAVATNLVVDEIANAYKRFRNAIDHYSE